MSEIKVNSIKGVAATTAALSINNTDGTCTANLSNRQGKNLVINGAMNVAQRQSASTSTQGVATVDRFKKIGSGCGNTFSQEQITLTSGDAYDAGFRKAFRVSQDQAGTANAAGAIDFSHYIEAQNLACSGWNYTSSSSKITLQFWFRASTNQTFYGVLYTPDGTVQSYPFSFTASGNNAWTKITHTISGNSNITINNDNGTGLIVYLIPFYGTDYTDNSKSVNAWSAHSTNYCPDMASTWLTAGASTFDVTGMQLEVGSVATDFEHRTYEDEFQKCLRYYEQMSSYGKASGYFAVGFNESTTEARHALLYKTYKRTTPTITTNGDANFKNHQTGTSVALSSLSIVDITPQSARCVATSSSAVLTDGGCSILSSYDTDDAIIKIEAEL
tara:strand:- start:180 stop:1343 length:1164 start_codon:yes stop_codon:yes gene_type:complete